MGNKKARDYHKEEPEGKQGSDKGYNGSESGASARGSAEDDELERRIILQECQDEIEGLEILDRMRGDPSWQAVIDALRKAAIDSKHAETILTAIIRSRRGTTYPSEKEATPHGRFSNDEPLSSDANLDDEDNADPQDREEDYEDEDES